VTNAILLHSRSDLIFPPFKQRQKLLSSVEILIKERDREKSDEEAKANAAVQLKIKVHKITSHCCLRKP
jgi:hypothetical protein